VNQQLQVDPTVPRLALRAKDAALALGISERQLWQKTDEGEIPFVKIGGCKVYPVEALRQYLAELLAKHAASPSAPNGRPTDCDRVNHRGINNAGCDE